MAHYPLLPYSKTTGYNGISEYRTYYLGELTTDGSEYELVSEGEHIEIQTDYGLIQAQLCRREPSILDTKVWVDYCEFERIDPEEALFI